MLAWLVGIVKDPEKRSILSWIGNGVIVVVVHRVVHLDRHDRRTGKVPHKNR
jgi:hypothetical protein